MFRTAVIAAWIISLAMPAFGEEKTSRLPYNTIDCKQFEKAGPDKWIEAGTAVFDLGSIKDINLTNQPVTPGYFKFDGIDLFPVVEQKCGAEAPSSKPAGNGQEPALSMLGADGPKPLPEPEKHSPAVRPPARAATSDAMPALKTNTLDLPSGSESCGDGKSIYVADASGADGMKGSIEIAISNGSNGEFTILASRNGTSTLVYKGKTAAGRLIFASSRSKQEHAFMSSMFMPVRTARQNSVVLVTRYIKPHRDGTGSAILYLSGLSELFGSKGRGHRLKLEGNLLSETPPEAFYFDRCE